MGSLCAAGSAHTNARLTGKASHSFHSVHTHTKKRPLHFKLHFSCLKSQANSITYWYGKAKKYHISSSGIHLKWTTGMLVAVEVTLYKHARGPYRSYQKIIFLGELLSKVKVDITSDGLHLYSTTLFFLLPFFSTGCM